MLAETSRLAPGSPIPQGTPTASPYADTPWTQEKRLQRIEKMGQRITGYVQFMCTVAALNGTSDEAKERAVTAFYEKMAVLERQLSKIKEDLQLG